MERSGSMAQRQRTASESETVDEHNEPVVSNIVRLKHPKSPDEEPETSSDSKRKGYKKPKLKSFGSFMHKVVKTMSIVALGPKGRRSQLLENEPEPTVTDKNNVNSYYGNRIPGVEGLRNHGNTCFINSVIQCLSHTDILAEYFVTDQYKADMDRSDKTNAKKFGTKGEVTEHLATLLKSLWSRQYSPEISSEFKTVVGKYGSQYRGYTMHDAQEFLMWLLDKVHEDLNTTAKKKYRANRSNLGRSDDMIAAEALANHMRNNNSFVHDLFQALLRSSLVCPRCKQQSNTFDPFICVSLPIPQKAFRPIYVTVVYFNSHPKQVRIGLTMDTLDRVKELRQRLADDTKIPARQLILAEIYYDGFHRSFQDDQSLTDIHETDSVYAIEVPKPYMETIPSDQYPENDYIMLLVLHTENVLSQGKRFGPPVVIQIPRDMKFLEIQEIILRSVEKQMRPSISPPHKSQNVLMKLRVFDGTSDKIYLPTDPDHLPLYMESVDRALAMHGDEGGPAYVRLVVEWESQVKQRVIGDVQDVIEEHSSVKQIKQSQQQPVVTTLDECFDNYTQEEELEAEDAWMCPTCRRRQQGTMKKLTLWSLPDILVIHLKRFKQIGPRRTKLNNMISFPLTGLDMAQHVVTRSSDSQLIHMYMTLSPWRRQRLNAPRDDDYVYDLYAVCNHYGNMQGGHYTAFCQSPVNRQWYSFDDVKVSPLSEDAIQTRAAYMLFYQRRTLTSLSSSSGTSASSAASEHWVSRIRPFNYSPSVKNISQSEENLLDESQKTEEADGSDSRTTLRTIESYGTMGRNKTSSSRPTARSNTFNNKWKLKKTFDISVSPKILRKTVSKLRSPSFSPKNTRKEKNYSQHAILVQEQYKKLEEGPVLNPPPLNTPLKPPPAPGDITIPYKESFRTSDGIRSPSARSPISSRGTLSPTSSRGARSPASSRGSLSPSECGGVAEDRTMSSLPELEAELGDDFSYITETCV